MLGALLGAWLLPVTAFADFRFKKGSFLKSNNTAVPVDQLVTGVGFRPKAVIFFYTRQLATGVASDVSGGWGFTTGPSNERAIATATVDAQAAPARTHRGQSITNCIMIITSGATGVVRAEAGLVQFEPDGFRLQWTVNEARQDIIHYIALGGSDITNAVADHFAATANPPAIQSVPVGFQPDFIMLLSMRSTLVDAATTEAHHSVGFATSPTARAAIGVQNEDQDAGRDTCVWQRTDSILLFANGASNACPAVGGAGTERFDLSAFTPTGFDVNKVTNGLSGQFVHYLALKGGRYRVGSFAKNNVTAAPPDLDQAVTGVGFQPVGVMLASDNLATVATVQAEGRISFGASDLASNGATWWHDRDGGLNPSDSNMRTSTSQIAVHASGVGGATVNAAGYLKSLDSDGFTTRWTANNTGAGANHEILYAAFGCCGFLDTTQTPSTVTVTAPAKFEMRFNTATGGGLDRFYDLAEDPNRTLDLAGGDITWNSYPTLFYDSIAYLTFPAPASPTDWFGWSAGDSLSNDSKLDLLEATSTRVKVRQESFYHHSLTQGRTLTIPAMKGFGDYSIYPSGKLALEWRRQAYGAVTWGGGAINTSDLDWVVHMEDAGERPGDPLTGWTAYKPGGTLPPNGLGTDDFVLIKSNHTTTVPNVKTDFLAMMYGDWADAQLTEFSGVISSDNAAIADWNDSRTGAPGVHNWVAGQSETFNFLTYFKPTNFANSADVAVTTRNTDYHNPDDLAPLTAGSGWFDADENTSSPSDFFNESEAAYTLELDPSTNPALDFTIDGVTATRYNPFFKIRQWRSVAGPGVGSFKLDGVDLVNGVDFRADVKPISRSHWASALSWHCSLQALTSCDAGSLDVGGTGSASGSVTVQAGRYGNAALFNANGDQVTAGAAGSADFSESVGAVEFWYQPLTNHDDGARRLLWYNSSGAATFQCFLFEKTAANQLQFSIVTGATNNTCTAGGTTYSVTVPPASYAWRANDWVHLKTTWNAGGGARKLRVFVNGVEAGFSGTYVAPAGHGPTIFGGCSATCPGSGGVGHANGLIDEPHIYTGLDATANDTPASLANGGLTTDANEYLGDTAKNWTMNFTGVDALASRRGIYMYLGADSKFRGLNVLLGQLGAGPGDTDLEWEYWNGTTGAWANLETVAGFDDLTKSFKKTGNVFWTSDPPNWRPYSVNGGPELFFVRVHLAPGTDYTTDPIEKLIKTDILLFQYCGDISTVRLFSAPPPRTTAVELMSFEAGPLDSAVELRWETGSELQNLGFHLYRSLSAEGPYERITATVIPGLGSSHEGASYRYVDTGLANGMTYFYRLEDIEATGQTKQHGPVQATPQAGAPPPPPAPAPEGGSDGSRISYGDPTKNGLTVTRLSANEVLLELVTEGFYGVPQADGTVRIEVPGFEGMAEPGAPSVPTKRAWVEAVAGRGVRLSGLSLTDVAAFSGLRPVAAGLPDMVVSRDGTVRAVVRKQAEGAAFRRAALYPEKGAQLVEVAFQGDVKKALLDLSPLRWDAASQQVLLAKRLTVRVIFAGVDASESSLGGSHGRREVLRAGPVGSVMARLVTGGRGLYGVPFEDLFGHGRGMAASGLRLSRLGAVVPFHVEPEGETYGPGSVLYFVSEGSSLNPWGTEAVYELELGRGVAMRVVKAGPSGSTVGSYWKHAEWEQNKNYQSGLLEAKDPWLWEALVSPVTKSYAFTVNQLAGSSEPSRLTVFLQAASDFEVDPDHHVKVSVNGTFVGEASWDGRRPAQIEGWIPAGVLVEGANQLQIENVGDTEAAFSFVFLDKFSVSYARRLEAEAGVLWGRFSQSGSAEVGGLVVDTTEEPTWVRRAGTSFAAESGRSYLCVDPTAVLRPEVRWPRVSRLRSEENRADYLLIGSREFLDAAEPLLERRRSQGLFARAVAVEDVYEEFGHGEASPSVLKDFIAYAYHHWQRPGLKYVVLLGDGSYDFKGYVANGKANRVLPLLVKTTYLWTASDPSYGAVNGEDKLPDVAVGRLSASSLTEAQAMVSKILAFEDSGQGLGGNAVLVADNADLAGEFEANSEELASMLPGRQIERIYLRDYGAGMRPALRGAFDRGASLMSYMGHGAVATWATENFFNNGDVTSLVSQPAQPFLMTMNCLNGFFHGPLLDSVSEVLVKASDRGAIAAFSPSGLSMDVYAHDYQKALVRELETGGHARLGDAILAAQAAYADTGAMPELLEIYHLFGDPALRLP